MEFLTFQPLMWLLAIVVLAIGLRFSLVDRPRWQQAASFLFRAIGIALLILALCRPFWSDESEDLHVVFLVDVSESVDKQSVTESLSEIAGFTNALRPADSWSLFSVADGVRQYESVKDFADMLAGWESGVSDDRYRSASRLAESLLETRLAFPAGKSQRAVLFSDGQETNANVERALRQLADEGIDVRFRPIQGMTQPEAAVVSLQPATQNAFLGEVVRVTARLATNATMKAKLRILHKGVAVLDRTVSLEPKGDNTFDFDVNMTTSGSSLWTAELIPDEDRFSVNNQSSCTVSVRGRPRLLILHESPKQMRSFARALQQQEFDVDVRGRFGLPESMEGLLAFDAIILANLPATSLEARQLLLLKRYVMDFGGGLAMFGSENSFGLGGYYKTPVEEVLPLVSRFEKEKEQPSLAMVLVIDKSGSMDGMPIVLARQAAKAAVELLGPRDTIGVLGFDDSTYVVSEMRSASEKGGVQAAIDTLAAGGGTYMYPAMLTGKDMLVNATAKIKHMVLLSDGQTQPADHESLAQSMSDSGITVSTVALGGADRQLLSNIAQIGRGRYYETNDPANVPQIFAKETIQASRSAIKEDLYGSVQISEHPILSGYRDADLPFVLGYVMTEAKPTAQLLLAVETGDPLLAVSRYGLGMGLAFTGDLTESWGGEWLAWDDCGKFWAQAFRALVRKEDATGLQVLGHADRQMWKLAITRVADNGQPVNDIAWEALALDEHGQTHVTDVQQVGLGRYETQLAVGDQSRLTVRIRDKDHDKSRVLHYHRPYPAEYRLSQQIPPALKALPSIAPAELHDDLVPVHRRRPVGHWAYLLALACLLAGLVLRRI